HDGAMMGRSPLELGVLQFVGTDVSEEAFLPGLRLVLAEVVRSDNEHRRVWVREIFPSEAALVEINGRHPGNRARLALRILGPATQPRSPAAGWSPRCAPPASSPPARR